MHDRSNVVAFPVRPARAAEATAAPAGASIVRLPSPDRERRGRELMQRVDEAQHLAALAGGVSADISLNEHLRDLRKEPWRRAGAKVRFLGCLLRAYDATSYAQECGIAGARALRTLNEVERLNLVEGCRKAVLEQLLTPVPTVADLTWKRRKAALLNDYDWVGATPEQVEKAIAADEMFLRSFPARHSPNRPTD